MGIAHSHSSGEEQGELQFTKVESEPQKVGIFCPGEQGKFTVYQQIKFFYTDIETENRQSLVSAILHNIVYYFELLKTLYLQDQNQTKDETFQKIKNLKIEMKGLFEVDDVKGYFKEIIEIWKDENVKNVFIENRLKFPQSIVYLFDNTHMYLDDNYEFTERDIISMRIKSIGIKGEMISYKSNPLKIICGAGQRNERKKWGNHNVNYLIWVFSLIDFVLDCYEDETTNRMVESFDCYKRYVQDEFFNPKKIFLYLNMYDVFLEIQEHYSRFKQVFEDYNGGENHEEILMYIIDKLYKLTPDPDHKLSIFITQANDKYIMRDILDKTLRIIVRDNYEIKGKNYYKPNMCPSIYKIRKYNRTTILKEKLTDIYFDFQ